MTFGSNHYVPVLKVKRGEKRALRLVAMAHRPRITPLLEVVEWRRDKKAALSGHLDTAFAGLPEDLKGYPRCFLDSRELAPEGPDAAAQVFDRAAQMGIAFTPVTGIGRTADLPAALSNAARGVALRLTRDEFERGGLTGNLIGFMDRHDLDYAATDLIIDLGPVEEMITEGIAAFATQFLKVIPNLDAWRTLTLSASTFPRSMGVVARKSHAMVDRSEWLAWRDHLRSGRQVPRVPTFSDCAIQHPAGVEGFDPVLMQVSASIRYALPEKWLLIKGESTRRNPPSSQFPELAKVLVYGHLRAHYAGVDHCAGCLAMKEAADGTKGYGSAEAWRRIGTIHHMAEVTQALNSLHAS